MFEIGGLNVNTVAFSDVVESNADDKPKYGEGRPECLLIY